MICEDLLFGAYNICLKDGNLGIFRVGGLDGGDGGGGDGGGEGLFNKIGFLVCILAMVFFFFFFGMGGQARRDYAFGVGGEEKLAYGVVFCLLFFVNVGLVHLRDTARYSRDIWLSKLFLVSQVFFFSSFFFLRSITAAHDDSSFR